MSVQCKNCRNCYVFDKDRNQYCCRATRNMCLTNIKKAKNVSVFHKEGEVIGSVRRTGKCIRYYK